MLDLPLTLLGLITIIGIDSIYLNLNSDFYKPIMGSEKINITYAILTWLTIIISIQLLVLSRPDLNNNNVFIYGVFLGFASYCLYNFTNAALYPDKWSNLIIIGDTVWGMILTGTISLLMYNIHKVI
jgi:uncharacterized membrane protein